ncbi:MAG: arginine decarboxylase, partial [Candidatus Onthovivens sp.]|nr:arginine decarboxylase [Candidatus Onthovivens sp.]
MKHDIDLKKQSKTPYLDNYQKYLDGKYTAFDVPGHHQGGIITPFDKVFTHIIYEKDINCPEGMDNLLHPHECIKEAQELYALATNAQYAKFLVNGSTSGILVMLLSVLKAHDKIILP